ncbi:MAG: hypothetical protein QM698_17255 [Micropepsaceae bacterium]
MSKIAAGVIGLVVGWLAATQLPLWPTPAGGVFEGWEGTYRADANGQLKRDRSDIHCPAEMGAVRLAGVSYNANMALECTYTNADDTLQVYLTLGNTFTDVYKEVPTTVRLARGDMPAVRITDAGAGLSDELRQDIVVVRGDLVEISVGCNQLEGELDQKACHALQDAFLADIDPLSLGF